MLYPSIYRTSQPLPAMIAVAIVTSVTLALGLPKSVQADRPPLDGPTLGEPVLTAPTVRPLKLPADGCLIDEFTVIDPLAVDSAADNILVDQPVTILREPVADEAPARELPALKPVVPNPLSDPSASDEPLRHQRPIVDEPASDEPVADEPIADEPVGDEPHTEAPVAGEPGVREPSSGASAVAELAAPEVIAIGPIAAVAPAANESDWWRNRVAEPILAAPDWVAFDLPTVLLDTLQHSPMIQSVSARSSVARERIIQQDAAFDPTFLFKSRSGLTNDPVGNTLTTGGPPRLRENTLTTSAGVRRTGRSGTKIDLSQNLGTLDSNSIFFTPSDQANSRLSLSLSQPLYAGRGQLYNERLLTQARLDGTISRHEARQAVEERLAAVMSTYWRLYEARCHLLQQNALLDRGQAIERMIIGRQAFDAGQIEMAKVRQRIARRIDRRLELVAEVLIQQSRLAALTGSESLQNQTSVGEETCSFEMIPLLPCDLPDVGISLRDAVVVGLEYRPEVRVAASELESAALGVQVTRNQLLPQIDAVVETYLAGLRGDNRFGDAFIGQFADSGPGIAAGIQYDLPAGRRYARSRHREAHHRYRQKSESLRETIMQTRHEIETALIGIHRTVQQRQSKQHLLETAIAEERILTRRWELMIGDSNGVGLVLETVLDAQQRRADAEREWISAQTEYRLALVQLERATGTLFIEETVTP